MQTHTVSVRSYNFFTVSTINEITNHRTLIIESCSHNDKTALKDSQNTSLDIVRKIVWICNAFEVSPPQKSLILNPDFDHLTLNSGQAKLIILMQASFGATFSDLGFHVHNETLT